jgi:TyrR family helix-turn-helix protein
MTTQGVDKNLSLSKALETKEREILLNAKTKYKSTRKMAKALGTSQPTIVRKLKKYNIIAEE